MFARKYQEIKMRMSPTEKKKTMRMNPTKKKKTMRMHPTKKKTMWMSPTKKKTMRMHPTRKKKTMRMSPTMKKKTMRKDFYVFCTCLMSILVLDFFVRRCQKRISPKLSGPPFL